MKRFKNFVVFILLLILISNINCTGSNLDSQKNSETLTSIGQLIRAEHISLSVPDPVAMVKWYTKNLSMIVVREGSAPNFNYFIADSGKNILLELANNAAYVPIDLQKVNTNSIHLAFMVKNISEIKDRLISNGAVLAEDIKKIPSGDQVLMLRDPWGLPIQFVERVNPMLKFADLRPEHFQINIKDTRAWAKWYQDNLGWKIIRQGGEPNYNIFMSDIKDRMMFELNQNKDFPMPDFENINHNSFHIAFLVSDITEIKEKLLGAGAKLVEDIRLTPSGDQVLMLRDPWGVAIQFVKRVKPMVN